jgi:hypothetical protein
MQLSQALGRASMLGIAVAVFMAASAEISVAGAATWICVPETAGNAVTSGGSSGECKAAYTKVELPPTAEMTVLNDILPHIKYVAEGIGAKPTIQFSGVNMQILNGEGKTTTTNGEGNLILGYDEEPGSQTGSHDLVLGTKQSYTSFGGLVAGFNNIISGRYATVSGGWGNTASGEEAPSVSGGVDNTASGFYTSVLGGFDNAASREDATVSGGHGNTASSKYASVSGGASNKATGEYAAVLGGFKNLAEGEWSVVYGGKEQTASKEYEVIG